MISRDPTDVLAGDHHLRCGDQRRPGARYPRRHRALSGALILAGGMMALRPPAEAAGMARYPQAASPETVLPALPAVQLRTSPEFFSDKALGEARTMHFDGTLQ